MITGRTRVSTRSLSLSLSPSSVHHESIKVLGRKSFKGTKDQPKKSKRRCTYALLHPSINDPPIFPYDTNGYVWTIESNER